MPESTGNVLFEDQGPKTSDSRAELLAGLRQQQKQINPKYFYDEKGSSIFEQITQFTRILPYSNRN